MNLTRESTFYGKSLRAMHFITRDLGKSSQEGRDVTYWSQGTPFQEYGTIYWKPYRSEHLQSLKWTKDIEITA